LLHLIEKKYMNRELLRTKIEHSLNEVKSITVYRPLLIDEL